jgi:hypothetical protein
MFEGGKSISRVVTRKPGVIGYSLKNGGEK